MFNTNPSKKTAITPTRDEDFAQWYQKIIAEADLAENSAVRGCMTIKPYGYAIWENIQKIFDAKIKKLGVENAYFPLLIPVEFLQKEAEHIDGFAKECAVVTHHRLAKNDQGDLVPDGKLEKPYIIRPTSEAIIGHSVAKWVKTYRDLPMKLNQWCNVMRWEMRPRIFLRTSEFLWQEGHTIFATEDEANQDSLQMLQVYYDFMRHELALPVIKGEKTPEERFPGACNTYTVECMTQDGKALQAGTSHYLGQSFSTAFDIKFTDQDGQNKLAYTASWGISTRLIGAIIMTHSDDNGLVLPADIAPHQVVIIPVINNKLTDDEVQNIKHICHQLGLQLEEAELRAHVDATHLKTQDKIWKWIKRGAPIRIEIGINEIKNNNVSIYRRDLDKSERIQVSMSSIIDDLRQQLNEYSVNIRNTAIVMRDSKIKNCNSLEELDALFAANFQGWAYMLYDLTNDAQFDKIAHKYSLSRRCVPFIDHASSAQYVYIAKSY